MRDCMKAADIRKYLAGGDRRSLGRANELLTVVERKPELLRELICEMWNADRLVAMRAADAVEKLTREQPEKLKPFKKELLGLAEEAEDMELQWHLAALLARLQLSAAEQQRAVTILLRYLESKSSIVKTFALQALFDLSMRDAGLRDDVREILEKAVRTGTAAMRARARKLLGKIAVAK